MAKSNFKLLVDMNIELPEGDTEITEQEKCKIINRIHHYLTEIGTTSDTYEGCLAGKIGPLGPEFELTVSEKLPTKVIVAVLDGVVQGARSDNQDTIVDIFDQDDLKAEGYDSCELFNKWNDEISIEYPYGIY